MEYQEEFVYNIAPEYNIQHYNEYIEIDEDYYIKKTMIDEGIINCLYNY